MAMPSVDESANAHGLYFVPAELTAEVNQLIRDGGCVEGFARHFPMTRLQLVLRKFATGVDGYWVDAMAVKTKDAPTFETVTLTAEKIAVNTIAASSGDASRKVGYMLETPCISHYSYVALTYSENVPSADNQQGSPHRTVSDPSETTRRPLAYFPYCKMVI